jgi:hypothetical protein
MSKERSDATVLACVACGGESPHRPYCEKCVRELAISVRENPLRTQGRETLDSEELRVAPKLSREEQLEYHSPVGINTVEQILGVALGSGGAIWVLQNRIVVKHFGLRGAVMKGVFKGEVTILKSAITAVSFRDPEELIGGFLQVSYMGQFQGRPSGMFGFASELTSDGTVMFGMEARAEFLEVYQGLVADINR